MKCMWYELKEIVFDLTSHDYFFLRQNVMSTQYMSLYLSWRELIGCCVRSLSKRLSTQQLS